jgi:hypothetical protein
MSKKAPFLLREEYSELEYEKRKRMYENLSRLVLFNGRVFTTELLLEFWGEDLLPSYGRLNSIPTKHIKWCLKNLVEVDDSIWNGSFLKGISLNAKVIRGGKRSFSGIKWRNNSNLDIIAKSLPYFGSTSFPNKENAYNAIRSAPCFHLPYDSTSKSFLSGFLCSGEFASIKGEIYIKHPNTSRNCIIFPMLGIPVEKIEGSYLYVSPIWGALFAFYMPKALRGKWLSIKKPARTKEYCPVLWDTYIGGDQFVCNSIPYLQSRATIFRNLTNDDVTVLELLQKRRMEYGFVHQDQRIIEETKNWVHKYSKEKKNEILDYRRK